MQRTGLLAGGNWIVDHVKIIDRFPPQDSLANILHEATGNGGSAYNLLVDLSRLGAPFPLAGVGLVGHDGDGRHILDDCQAHRIDTAQLRQTEAAATSYTDVMTVQATGRRTFFHQRGANALLDRSHFDLERSRAAIFHLGYLLLLDQLDRLDDHGRTEASYLLAEAQALGFRTSVDLVSENSDRFAALVPPALPYTDYLFLNDYEAAQTTGLTLMKSGKFQLERAREAAHRLIDLGVREWVFLHGPTGVLAMHRDGDCVTHGSVQMPPTAIVGAGGAGDALAAGVLTGLLEAWDVAACLELGVCCAATSLRAASCSGGVIPWQDALRFGRARGYHDMAT